MADIPANSHLQFELAMSMPSSEKYIASLDDWQAKSYRTYVELNENAALQSAEATALEIFNSQNGQQMADLGVSVDYELLNVKDIHLSGKGSGNNAAVDKALVLILSIVAVVVLLVAWINYLNLSLVKTLDRMKELGVRKCLGSSKAQLVKLFVFESLIMNSLAFLLTVVLINVAGGYLSQTTGMDVINVLSLDVLSFLVLIVLVGTLLTGFYPLVLLKSFNLASVLVGKRGKKASGVSRKAMVVVQFAVTFLLIAGTVTTFKQIEYMRNADLGIETENILVIQAPPSDVNANNKEEREQFKTMTAAMLKYPGVEAMTTAGELPGQAISWNTTIKTSEQSDDQKIPVGLISMNLGFTEFFDIDLIAGRKLRQGDDPWSKGDVVINEEMANQLGFADAQDAVSTKLEGFFAPLQVRGVLENHNHTSLHNQYQPIAYILSGWTRYYFFKLNIDESSPDKGGQLQATIANMQKEWDQVFPNYLMEYSFVDQAFDNQYKEDQRFSKIFMGFSVVTIVIACLGLFGLTALTVNQRIKEVGIRKVLGANAESLLALLTKEYAVLVLLAGLISMPVAYFVMANWLEAYSFRISLGAWFFLIPIIFVFGLALLSVSGKVWSVVKSNPVEALRYE